MESLEILTMRLMEWERIRGQLRALLQTYWNNPEQYGKLADIIEKFTKEINEHIAG